MPDVEIRELTSNNLIDALQQNQLVFDYATDYAYTHSYDDIADFRLEAGTFRKFRDFVAKSGFAFETRTEKALNEVLTLREEVVFTEDITADFKSLMAKVEKQKFNALDSHSDEIQKLLEDEIIKRYFYREGLYEYYLGHDPSIMAARELLGNASQYQSILQ
jgi:carboxyl-terminal processing protease